MKPVTRSVILGLLGLAVILGGMSGVQAAEEKKADFKKYPALIEAAQVKEVVDGQVQGYIFDARPKANKYDQGHIPGAVSLPASKFDQMTGLLPQDKQALIIFYCGGLTCPLSHKNAFKAEALGYTNVKVFATGYPAWVKAYGKGWTADEAATFAAAREKGYKPFHTLASADLVKEIVDGKQVGVVIDARPKKTKYDQGHIPGSLSLPTSQFEKMMGLLPLDKHALVVFYCGGFDCPLSHKAAYLAMNMGYSNVKVYSAGYPDWTAKYGAGVGTASAGAKAAADREFKAGTQEGSIDWAVFNELVAQKPESVMLIDVRDPSEFQAGHLASAVNIPSDDLEKKLPQMKAEKPIIFLCSTGARSGEAFYMVQDVRPDLAAKTYYLEAEIAFEKNGGYKLSKPK